MVRRGALFALLFGGAMGFVAWLARGRAEKTAAPPESVEPPSPVRIGATAPIGPKISVGDTNDASMSRDAVKVLGDKTVRYRSWTVAWRKSTPKKSPTPEVGVQTIEAPHVVLF